MFRFLPRSIRNSTHLLFTKPRLNPLTHFRSLHQETQLEKPNLDNSSSSLTLSYLINSCGLSPLSALSASKKIDIETTENPDSVLSAFRSFGFTNTQIENLITKHPKFLLSNFEKTIKPKLDYFISVGFSSTELAHLISSDTNLLRSSLEKRLKPNLELLTLIIGSTQQIAIALRRSSRLLTVNPKKGLWPKVRILQSYGIPDANIAKLVTLYPRALLGDAKKFAATVNSVKKYGFNPLSTQFVYGVHAIAGLSPSSWDRKVAVYKSLGWSDGEVISAFTRQPFCMSLSEEKIRRGMDFFVKEMHWPTSFLSELPVVLRYSLKKRVIPRFSVLRMLASKGLVKGFPSAGYHFLLMSEKNFLNKYVTNYLAQVPELLKIYKGDLKSMGFEEEGSLIVRRL